MNEKVVEIKTETKKGTKELEVVKLSNSMRKQSLDAVRSIVGAETVLTIIPLVPFYRFM